MRYLIVEHGIRLFRKQRCTSCGWQGYTRTRKLLMATRAAYAFLGVVFVVLMETDHLPKWIDGWPTLVLACGFLSIYYVPNMPMFWCQLCPACDRSDIVSL